MEPKMKKIVAVIVIAVVAVGIIVPVLLLMPKGQCSVKAGKLVTPGMPKGIADDHILRIGLVDPLTDIQGRAAFQGACLAIYEINLAGGVDVNGETYYFGLIAEDSLEAEPQPDPLDAQAAITKLLDVDNARYIIGGFRTEAVSSYIENVMDDKKLFMGTGASDDSFCANLISDYNRYKYWFRVMPLNSSSMGLEFVTFFAYLRGYLSAVLSKSVTKIGILREDLDWTVGLANAIKYVLCTPTYGWSLSTEIAYDTASPTLASDMTTYINQLNGNHSQVVVPLISAQGGLLMMAQYAIIQPDFLIAGIDVQSQLDTYWSDTSGDCEYELIMTSLVRTNKTPYTITFWDNYVGHYGTEPLYTAVGSYDAVRLIWHAIGSAQTLNSTELIPELEKFTKDNTIAGVAGNLAFTTQHDLVEGYDYGTGKIWGVGLFAQWQAGGTRVCVSSGGYVYPDYIVTGSLQLPPWGINDES